LHAELVGATQHSAQIKNNGLLDFIELTENERSQLRTATGGIPPLGCPVTT